MAPLQRLALYYALLHHDAAVTRNLPPPRHRFCKESSDCDLRYSYYSATHPTNLDHLEDAVVPSPATPHFGRKAVDSPPLLPPPVKTLSSDRSPPLRPLSPPRLTFPPPLPNDPPAFSCLPSCTPARPSPEGGAKPKLLCPLRRLDFGRVLPRWAALVTQSNSSSPRVQCDVDRPASAVLPLESEGLDSPCFLRLPGPEVARRCERAV